ncbi:kelch-like protein 10 [Protopterus annectens]|uniref:kelch-like protein 10 n=1 Tax=Protopterus annectens TaxID=7888 RepID=UPI001CFA897D|nr:kelch-like protein 10 [Protopterus annectens]
MEEPSTSRLPNFNVKRRLSSTSYEILKELREAGELCDAIIRVDGVEMKVHKNIMCSCSSYFRALFAGAWRNAEKQVYNIPGVSAHMMESIIEYAYTRTVAITNDNVEQLLAAASQFHVIGIVSACCEFLESQLCSENCIGIWKIANCYHCFELKNKANIFILHNFEQMVKVSDEILQLSSSELGEFIEKDELNVKQEEVVFEAIMKWISHEPQERKKILPLLLQKVRLAQMNAEYFMNNVKNNEYMKDNDECKPIIVSAIKVMHDINSSNPSYAEFRNQLNRPRLPYEVVFAFGGWSGPNATNVFEAYDARADMWVGITRTEENPRAYHGMAYLKDRIYIIGGFNGANYFSNATSFDPVKKKWQEVAPMHSSRCYVSVIALNGFIYAIGGFDGHIRLNTAERYQPETNQWTIISPMHEVRSDAKATTLHGKVYICGGFTGNECLFSAESYDPQTDQWTLIAPMTSRRSGIGVIAYDEQIYAVGGFDGMNRLCTAEAYDPLTDTWHAIPNMLIPRSNFGIEVVDDVLLVAGGYNGSSTTFNVECYDKKINEWFELSDMGLSRSALSCCVIAGLQNVKEYAMPRDNYVVFEH